MSNPLSGQKKVISTPTTQEIVGQEIKSVVMNHSYATMSIMVVLLKINGPKNPSYVRAPNMTFNTSLSLTQLGGL